MYHHNKTTKSTRILLKGWVNTTFGPHITESTLLTIKRYNIFMDNSNMKPCLCDVSHQISLTDINLKQIIGRIWTGMSITDLDRKWNHVT